MNEFEDHNAAIASIAEAIGKRNFGWAEAMCRILLARNPKDAAAHYFLAQVAAAVNRFDDSLEHLRQSLAAGGEASAIAQAQAWVETARAQQPPAAPPSTPRFLVIKAWGQGFWSDVDHVLGACLLAEATGRIPITDWGATSRYSDDPTRDAFTTFFAPITPYTRQQLSPHSGQIYPDKWTPQNLDWPELNQMQGRHSRLASIFFLPRPEPIAVSDCHVQVNLVAPWLPKSHEMHSKPLPEIYRYLVNKYLHPLSAITERVNQFRSTNFQDQPYIAVHVRSADKSGEIPFLEELNARYHQILQSLPPHRIFLLTDSFDIVREYKDRYGDRIIIADHERTFDAVPVHYKPAANVGYRRGVEVMLDTYVAAAADYFIGNGSSNVSAMVDHLRQWEPGRLHLVYPNHHYQTNPWIWKVGGIPSGQR